MIIRFQPLGQPHQVMTAPALAGERLSSAIWLSGKIDPLPQCGGIGLCGRCKARFIGKAPPPTSEEIRHFTPRELEEGWRLTCRHRVEGDCALELPEARVRPTQKIAGPAQANPVCVGIDLGTTSIQWQANAGPDKVAAGKFLNPQAGAGADIISRLALVCAGDQRPGRLARRAIDDVIAGLWSLGCKPERLCVAANSAMTEILLDKDVRGLCAAPCRLSYAGGEIIEFAGCETIIPPLPAPFVGGDVSAGMLACMHAGLPVPLLLADLGTNAELALLDPDNNLFVASAPCGPAMEGIGPKCGQQAASDVITAFGTGPGGLVPMFPDAAMPGSCRGISATGYISLLALLLRLGIMDSNGQFVEPGKIAMPLAKKLAQQVEVADGEKVLPLPMGQQLSASDIEMLLKVKAAFSLALTGLLRLSGLGDIGSLCLAGALGEYARPDDLAELGFFPRKFLRVARISGNTSLAGALLLCREPERLSALTELFATAKVLQLTDDENFYHAYLAAMHWGQ